MPTLSATIRAPVTRLLGLRLGIAALVAVTCICAGRDAGGASPSEQARTFLPGHDGGRLWHQTLATVRADWPIVRAEAPDFLDTPPRPGVIESAWVEPPMAAGGAGGIWPPQRQRVVVQVVPAADGAWIDAMVQMQSLAGEPAGEESIMLAGAWQPDTADESRDITVQLAAQMAPAAGPPGVLSPAADPAISGTPLTLAKTESMPWADKRRPRVSRAWHQVRRDYRNFYACESLTCLAGAFGAGALMANTGFDTTMQGAWQTGVEPTNLGTFFSGCKDIGEGRYSLPIFGAAYATGLMVEENMVSEWGGRSLRMFAVGAPPLYALQWATGGSRPSDGNRSDWTPFSDNNGVSGHAFVGAIPFLAAADMVESPLLKGTLYVCSTFVGFSRMTDDAHYPSQVFLGWYLAWASARAVGQTELQFSRMEVRLVPLPIADQGGLAVEARW